MQFKKITSIFELTILLLKRYNELKQNRENNIYRIIEIKRTSSLQFKLIIQIIGKSSIFECAPHEIVGVDNLLEGFSKKDVRTITYLACSKAKKPSYKIIKQEFCEQSNRIIFKIKKETTNDALITKTANQLVFNEDLIQNLCIEDVMSISYIAGYESCTIKQ